MASCIESLLAKVKSLPDVQQRGVAALLGATVADAATRPLHWIYNQDTLNNLIATSKQPEFWPESKSPFYTIPLGCPSGYNDQALVTLMSLNENKGQLDVRHICEAFKKHFGLGSDYADALHRRKIAYDPANRSESPAYDPANRSESPDYDPANRSESPAYDPANRSESPIYDPANRSESPAYDPANRSESPRPVEGPWIQKGVMMFLENYEKDECEGESFGDSENKEFDGFCAALPIIALHAGKKDVWFAASKVTQLLSTNSETTKLFHTVTMLVDSFIMGATDPISQVHTTIESLYPHVYELMNEVVEAKSLPYVSTVAKFGKACTLPGSLQGALLTMLHTSSYVDAVRLNITAGGCNCSRANVIGACYGAKYGIDAIPHDWLKKVKDIKVIIERATNIVTASNEL